MSATHTLPPRSSLHLSPRQRRWAIGLAIAAALLGAYVLGVTWFAQQLQNDMKESFQIAPILSESGSGPAQVTQGIPLRGGNTTQEAAP